MISALLTPAVSGRDLRYAWNQWVEHHGNPPTVLIVHKDLVYASVNDPEWKKGADDGSHPDTFRGVPVLTLTEFYDLHASDLGAEDDDDIGDDE